MLKKGRFALLLLVVCTSLLLSGCDSPFASLSSLMSPPKFSGELAGIEQVLDSAIKNEYSFVYPGSGEYRSSCIYRDFDGDGNKDAIVFYSAVSDNSAVHFNFLRRTNDKWTSVSDSKIVCTGIDKVDFADVSGDEALELLIGVNMYNANENQLSVYKINEDAVELTMQETYTSFGLCNLTKSEKQQILLLSIGNETVVSEDDSKAQTIRKRTDAKLVSLNEQSGTTTIIGAVELDPSITSFSTISNAEVRGNGAAYIDAYKGSDVMITELIICKNKSLINEFFDAGLGETVVTKRENLINSMDIDNDGNIEIPQSYLFPGQDENGSSNKVYYTVWMRYDGAVFNTVASGVYNAIDGYFLDTPENWIGSITVVRDTSLKIRTFYEWDFHKNAVGDELFRIQVFSKTEWENKKAGGFMKITDDGGLVYAVRINALTKSKYALTYDYIAKNFALE